MTKVKVTNTNILLMVVVLLLNFLPLLAVAILYGFFQVDLGEYVKEGDTAKAILLIINQYGLILLPVLIFIIANKLNVKEVFRLNPVVDRRLVDKIFGYLKKINVSISPEERYHYGDITESEPIKKEKKLVSSIMYAFIYTAANIFALALIVIMALAAWFISQFVTIIIYHIYSSIIGQPSNDVADVIPKTMALGMFLIALSPAICEEALFRGIVLKAYENRGTLRAIFISAIMFSLVHVSVVRLAGPLIIGILAAYLVIKSNSIIPGVITHFTFNGISMLIFYSIDKFPEEVERFPTMPEYFILSVISLICLIVLAVGIMGFNYLTSFKKEVVFRRPVGSVFQDFISIISYWPIIISLLLIIFLNMLEALDILLR